MQLSPWVERRGSDRPVAPFCWHCQIEDQMRPVSRNEITVQFRCDWCGAVETLLKPPSAWLHDI